MEGTIESTPATSTETSTPPPAASERPTSALQALTQAAAGLETPATTPETAATGQAAGTDPASALHPSTDAVAGVPPEKHWPTILDNARAKERAAADAEWRAKVGWAEQVDRASIERMAPIARLYQQDRVGYARQFFTEALTDPALGPVLRADPEIRAVAARLLGSRQSPAVDLSPDVPVVDEQGQIVTHTLSADRIQARIDAAVAKALGTFGETVDPLLKERETRQAQEQAAEDQRQLDASVADLYSEACDVLPHFKEHEAAIAKAMETIPGDPAKAMRQAWKQVVGPLLSAKAKAEVLDSFKSKAAAQTVDGSGKAASTPTRPRNAAELAAFMRQAAGG